ncbi:MAG: hypothetical protein ACD_43C00046G0005 [uncultured bacterium]|nr:MAG: hypothetical protein ACD_43C00046G0005 [uncultured bacterium]
MIHHIHDKCYTVIVINLPKTTAGQWSIVLTIVTPIPFFVGSALSTTSALVWLMLAGICAGVAAPILGLLAIIKYKDTAPLVYLTTIVGTLLMLLLIGEVVFSHN